MESSRLRQLLGRERPHLHLHPHPHPRPRPLTQVRGQQLPPIPPALTGMTATRLFTDNAMSPMIFRYQMPTKHRTPRSNDDLHPDKHGVLMSCRRWNRGLSQHFSVFSLLKSRHPGHLTKTRSAARDLRISHCCTIRLPIFLRSRQSSLARLPLDWNNEKGLEHQEVWLSH